MTGGVPEFTVLGVPDMNGSIRGKALRPAAFDAAVRDGSAMTELVLALDPVDAPITVYDSIGVRSGSRDLVVRPEPETLREMTWRPGWRICLGTPFWQDGTTCELASRAVLRTALDAMAATGHDVLAALEYEVRIRDRDGRPLSSGVSYSAGDIQRYDELLRALVPAIEAFGIELAAVHTEAGPGLLELNVSARPGLQAADDAVLLKFAVKEVAASLGLTASFLAKPAAGEEGSSGHIHLSCWAGSKNVFAPSADDHDLPGVVTAAIGGLIEHLPAASLLLNPNLNSYKRLVPGYFAPVNVSWGLDNRSAAVRVITLDAERSRIECRRPGADANPYLAIAALVSAMADGISRDVPPPPAVAGDAYARQDLRSLPNSLEEALAAFDANERFRHLIGDRFSAYFRVSRAWELTAWQHVVTDWERARYEPSA